MVIPTDRREMFEGKLREAFKTSWDATQSILNEVFEVGFAAGKATAEKEMGEKLAQVLGLPAAPMARSIPRRLLIRAKTHFAGTGRAPRGSVRPAVIEALESSPGLRPSDIAAVTGLNENSIRGMLNALAGEDPPMTEKRGDLWYLVAQK